MALPHFFDDHESIAEKFDVAFHLLEKPLKLGINVVDESVCDFGRIAGANHPPAEPEDIAERNENALTFHCDFSEPILSRPVVPPRE